MPKHLFEDSAESRLKHCHSVGLKMYHYALNMMHKPTSYAEEMYLLGLLHDIGYQFKDVGHEGKIYEIIKNSLINGGDYKYKNELLCHSYFQTEYDTPEMRLLYFADQTVDGNGNWCTYDERLADLEKRHGKNSKEYKDSVLIIDWLKTIGFSGDKGDLPMIAYNIIVTLSNGNTERFTIKAANNGEAKQMGMSIAENRLKSRGLPYSISDIKVEDTITDDF